MTGLALQLLLACRSTPGTDGPPAHSGGLTDTGSTADSAPTLPTCGSRPAVVEIGTGVEAYEPLTELQPLAVVFGPQGGYHLPVAVRLCDMDPVVTLHLEIEDKTGGAVVCRIDYLVPTTPDEACCGERSDIYGYLDPAEIEDLDGKSLGEYLDGHLLEIRMDAVDDSGHSGASSLTVTATYP